ncbi:MAG: hypothetical protein KUG54_01510 [Gammaproteobacteria bacterium]|nr:hypothetical protein [Gammaproteobacteria bacterium]
MAQTLVLTLFSEQAVMQHWRGRQLVQEWPLEGPEQSNARLGEIGALAPNCPVIVLADIADEELRSTQIPKVFGKARKLLLARSLNQAFAGMQYRAIEPQGTIQGQRKDEKLLLMAITRSDWIEQWLTALKSQQFMIQQVSTASMALATLARQQKWKSASELVVYRHHDNGLRQLFLNQGATELSRLSLAPTGGQNLAMQFVSEATTTRQYLNNSRALSQDATLTVRVLHRPQMGESLAEGLAELQQVDLQLTDISQVSSQLKLQLPQTELRADHLLGWVAANLTQKLPDFSSAATKYSFQRYANGQRLIQTASLVTVALLFWAASELFAIWEFSKMDDEQQNLLGRWQQLLQNAETDTLPTATQPIAMKQAVELSQQLNQQRRFPVQALRQLARALADQPDLRFRKIEWAAPEQTLTSYQSESRQENYDDWQAQTDVKEVPVETLFIELNIEPFDGNYLAAQNRAEQTARELRLLPTIESTELVSSPLNVDSNAQFSEQISLTKTEQQAMPVAKFQLILRLTGPSQGTTAAQSNDLLAGGNGQPGEEF